MLKINWNLVQYTIAFIVIYASSLNKSANAQEQAIGLKKINYTSWTYTTSDILKGHLLELREESIVVSNKSQKIDLQMLEIDISQIQKIKFRRKGSVGRGALFGAIGGIAGGALIGFLSGNDPPDTFLAFSASDKAIILGALFSVPGAAIGSIVGTSRINIRIENKQSKYVEQKKMLERYKR